MDDFILALGWVGVYAPLALGAVGSMVGVARAGMAACGALLEVESGYGRFIGVSAMPSSQTIYGIVVMLTLNVGVTVENAPGIFAIGLLAGIALMISGFARAPPAPRRSTHQRVNRKSSVSRLHRRQWSRGSRCSLSYSHWYWRARYLEWGADTWQMRRPRRPAYRT